MNTTHQRQSRSSMSSSVCLKPSDQDIHPLLPFYPENQYHQHSYHLPYAHHSLSAKSRHLADNLYVLCRERRSYTPTFATLPP